MKWAPFLTESMRKQLHLKDSNSAALVSHTQLKNLKKMQFGEVILIDCLKRLQYFCTFFKGGVILLNELWFLPVTTYN